jgi:hypothetical protein
VSPRSPGSTAASQRRFPTAAWIVAAACIVITAWIGAESDDAGHAFSFKGQKGDYYSLLVAGFIRGHLYMNVDADPRLESTNQDVLYHTPTLLDASYYKRHFYLYYGVVPAVILLLPYHLLTGQDLGINVACLLFWFLGFGAALAWLRNLWRDQGLPRAAWPASVAVLILAFFPATTFLVRRSMFYELPLAAGFAFISVFFASLYEVIQGRRNITMLWKASISLGLAIGCHPNHLFLLPLLAWVAISEVPSDSGGRKHLTKRLAAALIPVAAVGAGLAWYNYARFGSIFEFGFKYGQNGFFAARESLYVPQFFWANLKWYFLTPPSITPYFPFVFPGNNTFRPEGYIGAEAMHGQLPATLMSAWILAGVLASTRLREAPATLRRFSLVLGCASAFSLIFICFLQIRANRYMADFETPLAWLMAGWGIWVWSTVRSGLWATLWKTVFVGLAFIGSLYYVLAAVQQFDLFRNTRPASHAALERTLNIPFSLLYSLGAPQPGLLTMKARFGPHKDTIYEALVTTGTPGYSDSVNVSEFPDHRVQFSFNHKGYGGPASGLVPVDLGKEHTIEVSMGSFYPPSGDPYFAQVPGHIADLLKRLAYLRIDGMVVVSTSADFYEAPPWSREVGGNHITLTEFNPAFSGIVSDLHSVPVPKFLQILDRTSAWGILRYRVRFPSRAPLSGLPLLGIGPARDGNLVFAKTVGVSQYEVAVDDWGYGTLEGLLFRATPGDHDLQIILGPVLARSNLPEALSAGEDLSLLRNRVVVSIDGEVLGNFNPKHHLHQFSMLTPGANPQGFSTAEPLFGGPFEPFPMTDAEVQDLLGKAVRSTHR